MQFFTVCFPKHFTTYLFKIVLDVLVVTGVLVPLIGVLFGYTQIYLKVRQVKLQLRRHRQSILPIKFDGSSNGSPDGKLPQASRKIQQPKKAGYTQDDLKLAKTLFASFVVILVSW